MSSELARKFRFVSPGIFLREVDNSQLPRLPDAVGPTIIGRYAYGPAMRPFKVNSLAEFVETYGNPIPGASSGDVWREGNKTGPTYAAYAAFAWLNSGVAPANIVRLLGDEHDQNDGTVLAQAGWTTTNPSSTSTVRDPSATVSSNGGAYGLWLIPSGSGLDDASGTSLGTGSLAAIWYMRDGAIALKGKQVTHKLQADLTAVTGNAVMLHSEDSNYTFQASIIDSSYNNLYTTKFNFDRNSENYIRKVFNTDPILTNTSVVDTTTVNEGRGNYFLGETFESNLFNILGASGNAYGMILPIASGTINDDAHGSGSFVAGYHDHLEGFKNPETGWFFSQDLSTDNTHYAAERMTKLFKFHGLDSGEWLQNNIKISIADVRAPTSLANPYGTFTVQVRRASDTDKVPVILEQFTECDLNPASSNFVAAKVGDMFMEFDYSTNRLREYGQYRNQSKYIRIEMNPAVENGTSDPELLPFGVFGPIRPVSWRVRSNDGDDGATGTPLLKVISNDSTIAGASVGSGSAGRIAADGKATCVLTVADGDADVTAVEEEFITLTSTDGTTRRYVIIDDNATTVTTGTVIAADTDVGATTSPGALSVGGIAVAINTTGTKATQNAFLVQLKAAIEGATGHNGKITVSAVPTEANGAQSITLTQATAGEAGNTDVAENIAAAGATMLIPQHTAGGATTTAFVGGADLVGTMTTVEDGLIASHYSPNHVTSIVFGEDDGTSTGLVGAYRYTASYEFPRTLFRISASDGAMGDPKDAYFGLQTGKTHTDLSFDPGYPDYVRRLPVGFAQMDTITGAGTDREYSWTFSLDDVRTVIDGDIARSAFFQSGSRRNGDSLTAMSGTYKQILDEGHDRFTSPLYGGFDGFDIYESEPLRNTAISATDTQFSNYAFNTVKRAIDTVADPEFVETNLMVVPGITNKNLTKHLIDTAEARADALAIIDIEDVYTPFTENTQSYKNRVGSVSSAVTSLRNRDLDTSYAATYYPWVQVRDPNNAKLVWVPPSVVALGTFGSSEAKTELWFAPAGFTRGGLTDGSAGLPVVNVSERVVRKDRDKLYTAKINPIATFPAEGIVIFGQKTLQITPSALDRINVRRLLIFVKKEVSRFAATVLFDQNVQATWTRFVNKIDPFLASVQTRLGLTSYKIVLDDTTTTADLVDRNILYAKIFLKPARAIEYIAIDFVITRTGASFDD
jgi:hypothetical protein